MGDFGHGNRIDNQIPSAAQWNAGPRRTVREIASALIRLLTSADSPATAGYVFGGFIANNVAGLLQSTVTAGVGGYHDPTRYPPPGSPFGMLISEATTTLNHSAGDAVNPRYDLIVASSLPGTDTNEAVLQKGGGTLPQDTQRGSILTLEVVEGTPAASPTVPATPAGKVALATVLVPALAADLDAATYADVRPLLSMRRVTDSETAIIHRRQSGSGIRPIVTIDDNVDGLDATALEWSYDDHWPTFFRDSSFVGNGAEAGGNFYAMAIPFGRQWWHSQTWEGGGRTNDPSPDGEIEDFGIDPGVGIKHKGRKVRHAVPANAVNFKVSKAIQLQAARGLRVVGAKVDYYVSTGLEAGDTITIYVYHWDASAGTLTSLGSQAINKTASTANVDTIALSSKPVLDEGDVIYFLADVDWGAAGVDNADCFLRTCRLQLEEGHE